MKYLSLAIFILWLSPVSIAQDTLLPKETSSIYLHSGKKIEKVTLWNIDSTKVEFLKNGSLSDVSPMDVLRIESLNYRIEFDEHYQKIIRQYDIIILSDNTHVLGIIKKIDENTGQISYIPAKQNNLPLSTKYYSDYTIRDTSNSDDFVFIEKTIQKIAEVKTEPDQKNDDKDEKKLSEKKKPIKKDKPDAKKSSFEGCCLVMGIGFVFILILFTIM